MNHEQAIERFSDYLEGELAPDEAKALGEHLAQCEGCRAELEQFRGTMRSLSGLHRLDAPPEFGQRVERTIHRRSRGRFFGDEPLLSKLPFEWISFVIIILLLATYLLVLLDGRRIEPIAHPKAPAAQPIPERPSGD